ncbi:MAG: TetR/AcrR family transcriptional regulator [Streptosporangiales bacterium]|jgi:AcrR family transcriptional regulator|nr:TetR/AcrR family transcriptional regulator [Streptosporangiales bacterium]
MATDAPVRPPGTAKLPRGEREMLLLDAAREEFGALGYGGASLGSIAARAGVSKALIVTYFGSKDGLYAACVERAGGNLRNRIEAVITAALPPAEAVPATLAAIFEGLEGRQQDWHVLNDRTVPSGTAGAAAASVQRRAVAEQASRGVASAEYFQPMEPDDQEIIAAVWMSAVSAVVDWWFRHPDRSVSEMSERCARVLAAITHI